MFSLRILFFERTPNRSFLLPLLLVGFSSLFPLWALSPEELPIAPPEGIKLSQTPQFVVIGSDDNMGSSVAWFLDAFQGLKNQVGATRAETFDGESIKLSLYSNGVYVQEGSGLADHQRAHLAGHEIGNHTYDHIYVDASKSVATIMANIEKSEELLQTPVDVEAFWEDTLWIDTLTLPTQWAIGTGEYPDTLYIEELSGGRARISQGRIYAGYFSKSTGSYNWECDGKKKLLTPPFDGVNLSYTTDDGLCWIELKANSTWGYDYTELRRKRLDVVPVDSFMVTSYNGIKKVPGIVRDYAPGFRAPYLSVSDSSMEALRQLQFRYDCSIEAGFEERFHSRSMPWPFQLAGGYPSLGIQGDYPEIWELPAAPVFLPPDELAAHYGIGPGLRNRAENKESGKLTGLDYNMINLTHMDSAEYVATLKYTLDERLAGNRAPFAYGIHGQYYTANDWRSGALLEFIRYALSLPEVRIVSAKQLLDWMEHPVALDGTAALRPHRLRSAVSPMEAHWNNGLLTLQRPRAGEYQLLRADGSLVARFRLGEEVTGAALWQLPLALPSGALYLHQRCALGATTLRIQR